MRVLIFTSSSGTAHDAAAFALRDWIALRWPDAVVQVESVLENAHPLIRGAVELYNWIQKHAPWLHQLYWRLLELEDSLKPGTVVLGRRYVSALLRRFQPDLLISTHPHTNRGHFDLAKRVLGPQVRCITCNTELEGGFGFSRNWICAAADRHWTQTPQVSAQVSRRRWSMARYPAERVHCLGPLLYPAFHEGAAAPAEPPQRPRLVLASGANGANNHIPLLEQLLPLADRLGSRRCSRGCDVPLVFRVTESFTSPPVAPERCPSDTASAYGSMCAEKSPVDPPHAADARRGHLREEGLQPPGAAHQPRRLRTLGADAVRHVRARHPQARCAHRTNGLLARRRHRL